jgi:hypothetical protein
MVVLLLQVVVVVVVVRVIVVPELQVQLDKVMPEQQAELVELAVAVVVLEQLQPPQMVQG